MVERRGRALRLLLIAGVFVMSNLLATASRAAEDKVLQRVKGVVGYQPTSTAPLTTVFGRFLLPDNDLAVTRPRSAAVLTLPDSSIVALGENTSVQVGAFDQTAAGPGSTITVNGGSLRFDIRRPQGGAANYHFVTTTSQIAVRGTIGLISFLNGTTNVACLVCATDSVTVTVGTQTFALATGQVLTVTAAGTVVTGALTGTTLGTFSAAQVSTSVVTGPTAATAGIAPAVTTGLPLGTAAAAAGGAAAAGIAISNAVHASPSPQPLTTPTGNPTATPTPIATPQFTPTPTATATPTASPTSTATATPTMNPVPTPTATASAIVTISGRVRSTTSVPAAPEAAPMPAMPLPGVHHP